MNDLRAERTLKLMSLPYITRYRSIAYRNGHRPQPLTHVPFWWGRTPGRTASSVVAYHGHVTVVDPETQADIETCDLPLSNK